LSITSAALLAEDFDENRGRAFGIYNALKGAGYVLGPTIGGAIVWRLDFSMIFLVTFGVGILAFVLSLLLPPISAKAKLDDDAEVDFSLKQMTAAFRDVRKLRWYLVILINMFMVGILFGFLPVYVNSLGYNQLKNGLILAAGTASYLLVQPVAGYLADRFDPTRVVLVGLALSVLSLLIIPFRAGVVLVCAVVTGGIGVGTVWTNTDAVVSNLAEEGRLAATLGAAGSFKELGDMLGPLLIGIVSQLWGLKRSVSLFAVFSDSGAWRSSGGREM
jgi:MFS transporter, ACDE family, multidrug resistance protein